MAGNANSGGQNRKPTAMKVIEGTFRQDRANPNEPEAKPLKFPCPPSMELNEFGMKEWERSTRVLIDLNVLTEGDVSALTAMCHQFGEFVYCDKEIKEKTYLKEPKEYILDMDPNQRIEYMRTKYLVGKELKKLRKEHLEAYSKLAQQFGLTPVSRARVSAQKKQENNPLDDI